MGKSLTVAFIYDRKADYINLGYSQQDCADLADDVTIDGISSALERLEHHVVHVPGIKSLVSNLAAGDHKAWDVVFNYSEGLFGTARESQVPALLEAYQVPFTFSDAATLGICIDKGKTKMVLDHYELPNCPYALVPRFGDPFDYHQVDKRLSYPLFAKPTSSSTSNGITSANKILRQQDLEPTVEKLRSQFKDQEILLENFLGGREFTVAILGTSDDAKVLGVSEVTWYNPEGRETDDELVDFATKFSKAGRGKGQDMAHEHVSLSDPLVKEVAELGLMAYKALGCRDGGRIDIRLTSEQQDSVPCVIEANPIFGLRPDYSLYTWIAKNNDVEYDEMIERFLASALQRRETMASGLARL
ncbi:hypothetical protein N0V84_005599 [Fusarium piperis]|uniref:ATP-grasp domain-containing protein n=1 Tax=Fusarium piperis TaxID=1435070 RepID=A0A9W8WDE1_9HYPO|nr:hypothetical protein N0V84_005599 [Fusarium piperis]